MEIKFHEHILETPSGAIDGTNTEFIMSYTPDSTSSVRVFINGIQQFNGVDFEVVLNTITLDEAPLNTGGKIDDIKVEYSREITFET